MFFRAIEVGLPVTRQPPHRSLRAVFPHKAPQYCSLRTKARLIPVTDDSGFWYMKLPEHFRKPPPITALFLAAAIEPFKHNINGMMVEGFQHFHIAGYPIIIEVALQLGFERLHYFSRTVLTSVCFHPCLYGGQCQPELLFGRLHFHQRLAGPAKFPTILKTQKGE